MWLYWICDTLHHDPKLLSPMQSFIFLALLVAAFLPLQAALNDTVTPDQPHISHLYHPHRHTHAADMQPHSVDADEDGKGDRVWLAGCSVASLRHKSNLYVLYVFLLNLDKMARFRKIHGGVWRRAGCLIGQIALIVYFEAMKNSPLRSTCIRKPPARR